MNQKAKEVGQNLWRATIDLVVLSLLLAGAGFGGYYLGTHEELAPVQRVGAGTPGAVRDTVILPLPAKKPAPAAQTTATTTSTTTAAASTPPPAPAKMKYWLYSSGEDYIGSSITVKVNDTTVDNFFGPGKSVDVSRLVKPGSNDVVFEAKALGDQYNKHSGDEKATLTVRLVSGPSVQENFKDSDVLLKYQRSATDSADDSESDQFTAQ